LVKVEFDRCNEIEFSSQVGQDIFVLSVLKGKKNGYFVDLGSHEPTFINNTYILEKEFNWSGVLIEKDSQYVAKYPSVRNCTYICADACSINYREKFKEWGFPKDIDYLSMDLEPPAITFECLKQLPLDEYRFAVITYEHDVYRANNMLREESRKILDKYGYEIICPDVAWNAPDRDPFEDWYVHPDLVDLNNLEKLRTNKGTLWKEIVFC